MRSLFWLELLQLLPKYTKDSYNSQRANHLKWGLRERMQSSDEPVPRMFRIPLSIKLFIFK